jgi:hypothetical protein
VIREYPYVILGTIRPHGLIGEGGIRDLSITHF